MGRGEGTGGRAWGDVDVLKAECGAGQGAAVKAGANGGDGGRRDLGGAGEDRAMGCLPLCPG
jgi:hypothetical protein